MRQIAVLFISILTMVWSALDLDPHYNVPIDVVGLPLLPMTHSYTRFPARENKPWAQVGSRWSLP